MNDKTIDDRMDEKNENNKKLIDFCVNKSNEMIESVNENNIKLISINEIVVQNKAITEENLNFEQMKDNLETVIKNANNWLKKSSDYELEFISQLDQLIEESIALKDKLINESKQLVKVSQNLVHLMAEQNLDTNSVNTIQID
jgi:hypothetical protein